MIMKEEWKVYIKGVPNRGNEVIKALTDLGAKNPFYYNGNNPSSLYYIGHDGNIHEEIEELTDSEYIQIIMDNYRELKLPESEKYKPKYGDMYWIIDTDGYVKAYIWNEDSIDNRLFNLGNYFRTRKEAETMAEKFKKLLKDNL